MTARVAFLSALLLSSVLAGGTLAFGAEAPADGSAAASDDEACLTRCIRMERAGRMREGVSLVACALRLCQEEARRLYGRNEFEAALAKLDEVKATAQTSVSYHLERGMVYYALSRFEDALASFEIVLSGFPQSVRLSAQRAHTLIRLGRLPEARSQFEQILAFKKADAEIKRLRTRSYVIGNLGVLSLAEGDVRRGKRQLEQALEADARNKLARAYHSRVVPELEAGTFGPEGVIELQVVWEELEFKRGNSAVRKLGDLLRRWPDFKLGYIVAADAQRRYGNFHACESTLRAALSRFPDDITVQAERIRCTLMRKGVHSRASLPDIEALKALAQKDPDDPLVQEMMELIYE